jgi:hypothetical protein
VVSTGISYNRRYLSIIFSYHLYFFLKFIINSWFHVVKSFPAQFFHTVESFPVKILSYYWSFLYVCHIIKLFSVLILSYPGVLSFKVLSYREVSSCMILLNRVLCFGRIFILTFFINEFFHIRSSYLHIRKISYHTVKNFRTPCCTQVTKTKDSYMHQKSRSAETRWRAGD